MIDSIIHLSNSAGFSTRLRKAMEGFGSPEDFSRETGIAATTIRNYLSNKRKPNIDIGEKIAHAAGVSAAWLLLGIGPMNYDDMAVADLENSQNDYVKVPYYDVAASAGTGLTPYEYVEEGEMQISRTLLERVIMVPPKGIFVISACGDSMEPTIHSGARLILDRTPRTRLEGLFALTIDGDLYVKRLAVVPGKVLIISDNKAYEKMEVPREQVRWGAPENGGVGILGKVAHIIQDCD